MGESARSVHFFTVSARVIDVETGRLLRVSDYDLTGEFEQMITVGMGQVAAMLSMPDEADELTGNEESTVAITPQPVDTEMVTKTASTVSFKDSRHAMIPRYQLSYSIPNWIEHDGYLIGFTLYARTLLSKTRFSLQPGITVGRCGASGVDVESDGREVRNEYTTNYILPNLIARYHANVGEISLTIGLGYGDGEIYIPADDEVSPNSGLVGTIRTNAAINIGKISLSAGVGLAFIGPAPTETFNFAISLLFPLATSY